MNSPLYFGVVEDRNDPLMLGRCRVRILGVHTDNLSDLPTKDLPWATPIQPITSAAVSGVGHSPMGPVEGSWVVIVFIDDAMQLPVMMGSIAGIPGKFDSLESATPPDNDLAGNASTDNVVKTGSGGIVVDGQGQPVTTTSTPAINDDLSLIPRTPPPNSVPKNKISNASAGINALIQGCVAMGITNRNAVCSILGIAGVESKWIPQKEGYLYTNLSSVFKSVTAEQNARYNKSSGATREQVFSFLYGTSSNAYNNGATGRKLGNLSDEDGGKYYGRGVIQLTGRDNYSKYGKAAGIDILSNPDSLDTDLNSSAKVAAAYMKDRVKASQTDAAYFNSALNAVGGHKDAFELKRKYYEYFLGGNQPISNATPPPEPTKAAVEKKNNPPVPVPNTGRGFNDPNGEYPRYVNEPDVNRLARKSKLSETVHQDKKNDLVTDISVANSSVTWNQPRLPYNAKYPFNHVVETESGHVLELDDTDGAERIHVYHNSGTFSEIDTDGSKSEKIKSSSALIVEEDCLIKIMGAKHQSIGNDGSLIIGGQLQIQVSGNVNLVVGGTLYHTVTGDYNIKATGNVNIDGAQVMINSGAAQSAPEYTPTIVQLPPLNIDEAQYMELEETPRRDQIFKDANPAVVIEKSDTKETPPQLPVVDSECNFTSDLSYSTQLSTNFTLGDVCFDSGKPFPFKTGQHGLTDKEIACNLKHLCINLLEPLRSKYKDIKFKLNSGFRRAGNANSLSNGKISKHELGLAADISFGTIRGVGTYDQQCERFYVIAQEIRDSKIPFDKLIFECDPKRGYVWIHVQHIRTGKPSGTVMTYAGGKYVQGLHKVVGGVVQ